MIASLVIGSIPEEIRSVADANTRAKARDVFPGAVDYATLLIAWLGWMGEITDGILYLSFYVNVTFYPSVVITSTFSRIRGRNIWEK